VQYDRTVIYEVLSGSLTDGLYGELTSSGGAVISEVEVGVFRRQRWFAQ